MTATYSTGHPKHPMTDSPAVGMTVADRQVALPEGVNASAWALEKAHWQNPRIRSLIGCATLLESVFESNYALLHCSAKRVREILAQVKRVSRLLRTEFAVYLRSPSPVQALEHARHQAVQAIKVLHRTVLHDLDRLGKEISDDQLIEVRKLLCVSIGKIHSFLQESLGRFLAADPRSIHDADYFLSKRFHRDIEESEWLHSSVDELYDYLQGLEPPQLPSMAEAIRSEGMLPQGPLWEELTRFLDELSGVLTPKLKELLMLRGVRLDEVEVLNLYTAELPIISRVTTEIWDAGHEVLEKIGASAPGLGSELDQRTQHLKSCHEVYSLQIARLVTDLEGTLQDFQIFVLLWLDNIKKRRALMLRKTPIESG